MILALTKDKDTGGAWFRIERRGVEFLAKWISAAGLFPCEGARDAESERALVAAFEKGGGERVTRLYRCGDVPEERAAAPARARTARADEGVANDGRKPAIVAPSAESGRSYCAPSGRWSRKRIARQRHS